MVSYKANRAVFEILFDYVQHYGGSISVASLVRLTSKLSLPSTTVRSALSRLTSQGWIERSVWENQSFYTISAMGHDRLEEARPRIFVQRNTIWDGQWTLLVYSMPEKLRHHRDRLRRELNWLGFGALNAATWISPKPDVEITFRHLAIRKLDSYVHIFRARQVSSLPHQELVKRCWNLDSIQAQYRKFVSKWEILGRKYRTAFEAGDPPSKEVCFTSRMLLLYEFGEFLHIDPELPSELLPEDWSGHQAWRTFRDCYSMLAEPALDYFELVFQGPPHTRKEQREGRRKILQNLYQFT